MKLFYPLLLLPFLAGCPFNKCGNNNTDANEACDDGNTNDADGCEADCSLPACNNDIKDPGETCFATSTTLTTDTEPTEPVAADFNGDGHQDIITANLAGNSVSVLLGDGIDSFARQADVELGSPVSFVAAGDFDGDLIPDFAASLQGVGLTQILVGQGDGIFGVRDTLGTPNPSQLTTADINNDGDKDIIASSNDGIALFLNDGTGAGTFEAPRISFIGSNPFIAAADFDGDGNIDVAAGINGNLTVLLGDGQGNLAPQAAQLTGAIQGRITAADFNGDQLPDLAVANSATGSVNIFTNQAGSFTQTQTFSVESPIAIAVADLNNDGTPDLVVASDVDASLNSHLVTITSDGDTFSAQAPILIGNASLGGITTADLNEDQLPDVIVTNKSNNQLVLFLSQP